ncbi:hypothetical protein GN958_ATG23221 [Phytophthora infestans]|uniref:Secreted RxLR effector peptide protein n=1 Tax=Phytophthora infestans TaxID=4787 RepID=A0A8S9TJD6_PHYIN|nr:hypothetical protein GN958_ATG23221 [Phytophthora infestans]
MKVTLILSVLVVIMVIALANAEPPQNKPLLVDENCDGARQQQSENVKKSYRTRHLRAEQADTRGAYGRLASTRLSI